MNNKLVETKTTVLLITQEIQFNRINPEHYLQREADQWNSEIKNGFIGSVIKGENFDSIKLNEQKINGRSVTYVMDGKQRLTTIVSYRNNEFAIGKSVERPIVSYIDMEGNECEFDIRGKRYNDLPDELRHQFDSCQISVDTRYDCTDEDLAYDFRRYNLSKSLNSAQKGFTYADRFARQIKDVAANDFFNGDCGHFTETERRNGAIPRVVIETAMTTFHLDDWKKQTAKIGTYLSENATKEEFDKLDDYFTRLQPICDNEAHAMEFCSKNTFIFVPVFDRFTKYNLPDEKFGEFLDALEDNLGDVKINFLDEELTFNELNARQGTKDKANIIAKIEVLTVLMERFLHIDPSKDIVEEDAEDNNEESIADFVRSHVDAGLTDDDVETIVDCCEDYMLNSIKIGSKLYDDENQKSMVAIVAYMQGKDFEDDEIEGWMGDYAKRNNSYMIDQDRTFNLLKDDIYNTTSHKGVN